VSLSGSPARPQEHRRTRPEAESAGDAALARDATLRDVVDRYVATWERNDVDAVVAMLTEDVRMMMPLLSTWYGGPRRGCYLPARLAALRRLELAPPTCERQRAARLRRLHVGQGHGNLHPALNVLTLRGAEIEEITAFVTPDAFSHFGLPERIPGASDHLKYFFDTVSATFVYAGLDLEETNMFSGVRGRQIAGRFIPVRTAPFSYNTTAAKNDWKKLVATMEQSLRLHRHKPGTLIEWGPYCTPAPAA
jgi:hypothetical protein